MTHLPTALRAALACVVAASAGAADLTIVYKASGMGGERASTHVYTAQKARFSDGDTDTIVDFASGTVTTLNHKKKEISEITFDAIEKAVAQASAQMEQAMAGMPAALRGRMMGDAGKEVTVVKGETRTIAGVSCTQYTIGIGDNMQTTVCSAASLAPPFDPAQFSRLARVTMPAFPGASGFAQIADKMREIKGFQIATSTTMNLMGRKMQTTMEATEIKQGPVAAGAFDVPSGYKKVASPFEKMGR